MTTAARVSTYAFVNPIVALGLGWLILGEQITPRTPAASAVILLAVITIVAASPRGRKRNAPPPVSTPEDVT